LVSARTIGTRVQAAMDMTLVRAIDNFIAVSLLFLK